MSLEQHLQAVRGPPRVVAERCDLPFESCAPKRRDNVYSSVTLLGAVRDVFAIRRPIRLPIVPRSLGDLYRIAAADLLHPDVEFSAPIGTIGEVTAVGRPSSTDLQAVVERDAGESALPRRLGNLAQLVKVEARSEQQSASPEENREAQSPRPLRRMFRHTVVRHLDL